MDQARSDLVLQLIADLYGQARMAAAMMPAATTDDGNTAQGKDKTAPGPDPTANPTRGAATEKAAKPTKKAAPARR